MVHTQYLLSFRNASNVDRSPVSGTAGVSLVSIFYADLTGQRTVPEYKGVEDSYALFFLQYIELRAE